MFRCVKGSKLACHLKESQVDFKFIVFLRLMKSLFKSRFEIFVVQQSMVTHFTMKSHSQEKELIIV
jgi:hypothetical protein